MDIVGETFWNYYQRNKFNGYNDFEECDFCTDKATTDGCFNCNIFRIKSAVDELNRSIMTKTSYEMVLYMLNEKYRQYIEKYSKVDVLPKDCVKWVVQLPDDCLGTVIQKQWFKGDLTGG